jgi:dTDP-4-dehydrorhamnose reductase
MIMHSSVLVTGGSGLLGGNLATLMADKFSVHSIVHKHPAKFETSQVHKLDITKCNDIVYLVEKIKPAYIIHTAALTNVDYCEVNKDEAWLLNVEGTRNIIHAAEKTKSKLIYISTDSVFDGKKGMYTEEDSLNPLNFYAFTKFEGEKLLRKSNLSFVIIRTNIYGWNMQKKLSLAEWMFSSLRENRKLTLFYDVFFTPILVNNLSDVIMEILEKDICGVFHIAGSERCSKFQFGLSLAQIFDLDTNLIEPISLSNKPPIAKRPLDSSLCTKKIASKIKTKLLNVKEGLQVFKSLYDSGYVENLRKCLL